MINPRHKTKEVWDIFSALVLLVVIFEVPLRIAFAYTESRLLLAMDIFVFGVFLADILLNFRTAFRQRGELVEDKKAVRSRYLKSWFVFDILGTVPFDLVLMVLVPQTAGVAAALKWIRLTRIFKIPRLFQLMARWQQRHIINPSLMRLLLFGIVVSFFAHWIACFWITIGGVDGTERGAGPLYLHAYYWTVTTITTVGYGDITPNTNLQILYTMVVMVLGVGVWAYVIGNIASLLAEIDISKAQHKKKMEDVTSFFRYREIPHSLRDRVRSFYDLKWERQKGYDESAILSELPFSLKTDIAMFLNREILEMVPIFQGAGEKCIRDLATRLRLVLATPGDYIMRKGDMGHSMYFISRGHVEVVSRDGASVIASLKEGQFFGELALLTEQPRTATIRCMDYCDLYVLEKEDFNHVLEKYPDFSDKITAIVRERQGADRRHNPDRRKSPQDRRHGGPDRRRKRPGRDMPPKPDLT